MTRIKIKHQLTLASVLIVLTFYLLQSYKEKRNIIDINDVAFSKVSQKNSKISKKIKFSEDSVSLTNKQEDILIINSENEIVLEGNSVKYPILKEQKNDVPVIIVDEHQEVIPYWYKAVEEGIIRDYGNTLIHIDGHSDMASPEDYNNALHKFKHHKKAAESSYLPLMQSNDVFIISAILKGLISHVVWVQPSWNTGSQHTTLYKSYVGLTIDKETNKRVVCECRETRFKNKTKSGFECSYEKEDDQTDIEEKDCKKIRSYTYIVLSEKKFIKLVDLTKVNNLFVDIDEDYFGVESGVQMFINDRISLETQEIINAFLERTYCFNSAINEQNLNAKIREIFGYASSVKKPWRDDEIIKLKTMFKSLTGFAFCPHDEHLDDAVMLLSSINSTELKALAKAKFCLLHSPRLNSEQQKFQLCHGSIYPGDTLNQIYVGNEEEIKTRGKQITNMINFIYNHTQPRFFTIARSLRDGYTPRRQQRLIESVLLESLDEAISKQGQQKKVIYDKELVFGKPGWTLS